ncbi:MAG: carbohydrate ABC transporter permease [Acutalibacteraceae bacterium]
MRVRNGFHIHLGKLNIKISVSRIFVYLLVILLVCFTALPLIYVISTAFKPLDELLRFPPVFFVRKPTLDNFRDLLFATSSSSVPFLRYVTNSVFLSVVTVLLTIFISSIGAYSLVKLELPFKNKIFNLIVMTLMFPGTLMTIPNYLVINKLGLMDSYWALILPKIAGAFGFFFVKQFCDQLPDAFLEAARLDGANEFQIFTKIVFPFMKPACSTLVVFTFVNSWNDSFSPMVYITEDAMRTLPVALQSIGAGGSLARAGVMAVGTFISTLPTVVIYTIMQRRVIATMAYSGIK